MAIYATVPVTIASGASLSAGVNLAMLGGPRAQLVAIQMPAAWTAAALTFQGSADGTTYYDLYNATAEVSLATPTPVGATRYIVLDPNLFAGFLFIKVRSGTAAAPVNQGATSILKLLVRNL